MQRQVWQLNGCKRSLVVVSFKTKYTFDVAYCWKKEGFCFLWSRDVIVFIRQVTLILPYFSSANEKRTWYRIVSGMN